MTKYFPDEWLETTVRVLKEYLEDEFDQELYEIVAEFPGANLDLRKMPLHRTIVHFEIDDISSDLVSMGDNIFDWTVDEITGIGTAREAQVHLINFDIGIWASDASGGTTSRMRAKQILQNAIGGARGITRLRDFSDNGDGQLEIIGYSGGRFMVDRVADVQVYRMIESTLIIRVFSRSPIDPSMTGPAIMEIPIDPDLKISDGSTLVEIE